VLRQCGIYNLCNPTKPPELGADPKRRPSATNRRRTGRERQHRLQPPRSANTMGAQARPFEVLHSRAMLELKRRGGNLLGGRLEQLGTSSCRISPGLSAHIGWPQPELACRPGPPPQPQTAHRPTITAATDGRRGGLQIHQAHT